MAVTFSVKLAFFRENAYFREIRDFLSSLMLLLSFMKVSAFYQQHLCGFCCLLRVTLEH